MAQQKEQFTTTNVRLKTIKLPEKGIPEVTKVIFETEHNRRGKITYKPRKQVTSKNIVETEDGDAVVETDDWVPKDLDEIDGRVIQLQEITKNFDVKLKAPVQEYTPEDENVPHYYIDKRLDLEDVLEIKERVERESEDSEDEKDELFNSEDE